MTTIIDTFRKRSMARMAFLSTGISEICSSWETFGESAADYALMKPYRLRRVLNSDNPTIGDCELVAMMLGVELGSLMFTGGAGDLEIVPTPSHIEAWRERLTTEGEGASCGEG